MSKIPLSKLKNPGSRREQWLNAIGVYSRQDLEDTGAVDCGKIPEAQGYNISLNLANAIEARCATSTGSNYLLSPNSNLKTA
ncbi:MAG: TfoX/Sxy family protein [Gammaproteobacteria bacterium]|nr:TfoX/Sxy family protein [Gammaproteobacteria bacterium]